MKIFNWTRWKLILFSVTGLLILAFFIWRGETGIYEERSLHLKNPEQFHRTEICLGYIKIEKKLFSSVSGSDKHGNEYYFLVNPTNIHINERYSFKGTINSDGKIKVNSFQHHPFRVLKYSVSALSLLLVIYLMIIHIRVEQSLLLSVCNINKGLFASRRGIGSDA